MTNLPAESSGPDATGSGSAVNGFAFWGGVAVERKPPKKPRKPVESQPQGELGG